MPPDDPVDLTPAEVYHPAPVEPAGFDDLAAGPPAPPRPPEPPSNSWRLWLAVGVLLQALAVALWYFYAFRG
jgi:hypothetical protein